MIKIKKKAVRSSISIHFTWHKFITLVNARNLLHAFNKWIKMIWNKLIWIDMNWYTAQKQNVELIKINKNKQNEQKCKNYLNAQF